MYLACNKNITLHPTHPTLHIYIYMYIKGMHDSWQEGYTNSNYQITTLYNHGEPKSMSTLEAKAVKQ